MIRVDADRGILQSTQPDLVYADLPYSYRLHGKTGKMDAFEDDGLSNRQVKQEGNRLTVSGTFQKSRIELIQVLVQDGDRVEETITLKNTSADMITMEEIALGFVANLNSKPGWRLCAIPFRVQLDGSKHDYPVQALIEGQFHNAVYSDKTRPEPLLRETSCLRSEAWAWGTDEPGLVVIKYNNTAIELSVACPQATASGHLLRFGGAGLSLYGEPSMACQFKPGDTVTFGTTVYIPYTHGITEAYSIYRAFLDAHGHTFPDDYNPPVNWNELYDVGWYHSDQEKLKQHYTRSALLGEAAKARDCGCEVLYLDPGWEVVEGTTLWDESRLGTVPDFIRTLKDDYGLELAYRTILRCYKDAWPHHFMVKHPDTVPAPVQFGPDASFWELCLCNPEFWQEKLRRILAISTHGVRFMMFDEMDWRGPCYDTSHGHHVPTTPLDHVQAVYALANAVRAQCPGLSAEVHDPVWPWAVSIYVPTYFQHGFSRQGMYDENWGFEYMWDCLNDLRSGRALALYYYALGCNVPLYLHITMAADNDQCVFFWWTASTVRHLGIGGKNSNKTIEPAGGLTPYDPERRFAAYQRQMGLYQHLKPYFVRGRFHGIAENVHLHTLPGHRGGVVNVFNLSDTEQQFVVNIPVDLLGAGDQVVSGAHSRWSENQLTFWLTLPPMCPAVVRIGEAA